VIDNAVKLIREGGGEDAAFTIDGLPYDDPAVYALLGSGDTDGVFQVESSGMKDLCLRLKPSTLEDVTAINALFRPGPLGSGMVDDFIDRKHGRQAIAYDLPQLEPILRDTYGVILYQEQVMQIARELAGFSLGQADMLRRAMGKKKPEEMAKYREIFMKGSVEKGIAAEKAGAIFDLMAKFAEYGFNKSHSAAYAVLTYQTGYLKAHYPAEFMAALMTTEMSNTDKIAKYVGDARSHSIPILPPDVNASQRRFSVERVKRGESTEKAIRFGLEAIKGVGGSAVDAILEARKPVDPAAQAEGSTSTGGPFKNVMDFVRRVSVRKTNKKVMESLTVAGAFDGIAEVNRASLFESLEGLLSHAADEQEERSLGQSSLFDAFSAEEVKLVQPASAVFKEVADWSQSQKLIKERAAVGFYVSGHPMDAWQRVCDDWLGYNTQRLKDWAEKQGAAPAAPQGGGQGGGYQRPKRKEIQIAGLLADLKEITTKKGSRMGFSNLEDLLGKVEIVFFPEAFETNQEKLRKAIAEAEPVVITGELDHREGEAKILARNIEWLQELQKGRARQVFLRLDTTRVQVDQLRELKRSLLNHRGKCPVQIEFRQSEYRTLLKLPTAVQVSGTAQMVAEVNRIFGEPVVDLR
jgi:DNA polymerase-3 subunit alpha